MEVGNLKPEDIQVTASFSNVLGPGTYDLRLTAARMVISAVLKSTVTWLLSTGFSSLSSRTTSEEMTWERVKVEDLDLTTQSTYTFQIRLPEDFVNVENIENVNPAEQHRRR